MPFNLTVPQPASSTRGTTTSKRIGAQLLSLIGALFNSEGRSLRLIMSGSRAALILCALSVATVTTLAQNVQFTQGSVGSGLDNSISIPLGGYPGRGAASLPINISYSSRVWRIGHLKAVNESISGYQTKRSVSEAIFAEYSVAGWVSSLDAPKVEWPKEDDLYWYTGKPYSGDLYPNTFRIARVFIHMPDGSTHELRKSDQPYRGDVDMNGTFYAVDGSRMRYDSPDVNTGENTLYLPDGTRYIWKTDGKIEYRDRNGNTLSYNPANRQWKDTMGRDISVPLPSEPYVGDIPYEMPGFGGLPNKITYIFRWKRLADVLTPNSQGQTPVIMNLSTHYLPNSGAMPTDQGGGNFPQAAAGDSLFHSDYPDDEQQNAGSYTYVVGRGQLSGQAFNPVVLAEIELPNHLKYTFGYNNYGEITKVTSPTGAHGLSDIGAVASLGNLTRPYTEASRGVTKRMLSADGSGQDYAVWEYIGGGTQLTTKAPNGTVTDVIRLNLSSGTTGGYWPFGLEDPRQGMVSEERIYAPNPNPTGPQDFRGPMLRRNLTNYVTSQFTIGQRQGTGQSNSPVDYQRSARPDKEVSLILDTGGDALAKTMTYAYDTTYQMSTGIDLVASSETQFASVNQTTAQTGAISSIPAGAVASRAEMTYLDSSTYRVRNILGLVTSVVLKDAAEQVVSKAEMFYDEAAHPLLTYGDLSAPDYIDPQTTVRGNVTTARRYMDIGGNLYLETHAQFDQCGNVRKTWNERDIEAQTEYHPDYKHAYLTSATTVAPDPSGQHGSATSFTSSSNFDYTTGLVLSTTDANGQTTTLSYVDPNTGQPDVLNRPRKVTRPDGGWTITNFNDVVGDLYTVTQTKQDTSHVTEARQYFDKLGRSVRSFAWESGTDYLASDTQYDLLGRVLRVSNPYRTQLGGAINPSNLWTTSGYDALSRVTQVSLPDGTSLQTSYQGIYATATDQAGKSRRQKVDALGRIIRVDEPDANNSLGNVDAPAQATAYDYDILGNIIHITQGTGTNTQHRYFKYDALSRLTHERQVEQVAPSAFNLYDPLTGNSQWTCKLSYDETLNGISYKGLLTTQQDARQVSTQFAYDQLSRPLQVTYSDGTPAVSNYYDQPRTGYFNKGRLTSEQTAAVAASGQVPALPATAQSYDYDLMGRAKEQRQQVDTNTYTLSYTYNLAGQLTSETYPSGRVVTYAYGDAARLASISSNGTTYASQFVYGSKGLLSSVRWGNNAVESYEFNDRLQLINQSLVKDSVTIQRYEYKYGQVNASTGVVDETKNNGQIGRIESFIGTQKHWQQRFTYDQLGRLSAAGEYRGDTLQQTYLLNYDYDLFGNRYQKQAHNQGNPFTQSWVEDADINKLTNRLTTGVSYDNAGNITQDTRFRNLQLLYDVNNRQRQSANLDGSNAVTSIYDGAGQRIAIKVNGGLSISVYDAFGKLVAEYGQTIAGNGGTQYSMSDQQGTPRVVLNDSGSVLIRHDYQPFGEELSSTVGLRSTTLGYGQADAIKQKYAGMEADETGLSHTLWRQYDGKSGRWTSPDPYGGSMTTADPQSFNRYSYVNNDPVNKVDPLGLMAEASQSWGDASGSFWPAGFDFNGTHFGGPEALGEALIRNNDRENKWLAKLKLLAMLRQKKKKSGHTPHHGGLQQDDPDDGPPEVVVIYSEPAFKSLEEAEDAWLEAHPTVKQVWNLVVGNYYLPLTGNHFPMGRHTRPRDLDRAVSKFAMNLSRGIENAKPDGVQLNVSLFYVISGTAAHTSDGEVFAGGDFGGYAGVIRTGLKGEKVPTVPFSISVTAVHIAGIRNARERHNFFDGLSGSVVGGNFGGVGGIQVSTSGRAAFVWGVGTPGISAGPSYSKHVFNTPLRW